MMRQQRDCCWDIIRNFQTYILYIALVEVPKKKIDQNSSSLSSLSCMSLRGGVIWVRVDVSAICSRMNIKISNPRHLFFGNYYCVKKEAFFFTTGSCGSWELEALHQTKESFLTIEVGPPLLHINPTGRSSCDVMKETLLTDETDNNEPFLQPAKWRRSKADSCANTFH